MVNVSLVLIYAILRMIGGRSKSILEKWHIPFEPRVWKRFIAPSFLGLSVFLISGFWMTALVFLALEIASAFMDGYGNDSGKTWREVIQRVFSSFASTLPAVILAYAFNAWWLLVLQLLLALIAKIGMNFLKIPEFKIGKLKVDSAMSEELVINLSSSIVKPFMV